MSNPVYLLNSVGQRVDCIVAADGTVLRKIAVGLKVTGLTGDASWQGVATHTEGASFDASDAAVVAAGVSGGVGGPVVPLLVDASGRLILSTTPSAGTMTDRSGTITAGGTRQAVAVQNLTRKYFLFVNISDTVMWINFGTNAVADEPSIPVAAGGSFVMEAGFVDTGRVDVMCATTSKKFVCKEA